MRSCQGLPGLPGGMWELSATGIMADRRGRSNGRGTFPEVGCAGRSAAGGDCPLRIFSPGDSIESGRTRLDGAPYPERDRCHPIQACAGWLGSAENSGRESQLSASAQRVCHGPSGAEGPRRPARARSASAQRSDRKFSEDQMIESHLHVYKRLPVVSRKESIARRPRRFRKR